MATDYFCAFSRRLKDDAARALAQAEFISTVKDTCERAFRDQAAVVRSTRPTMLPMRTYGNFYKVSAWSTPVHSVSFAADHSALNFGRSVTTPDGKFVVTGGTFRITFVSMPDEESFKRWESVILSDFFSTRKALHEAFGIKWDDVSKTETDYVWDELTLSYQSAVPLVFKFPCRHVYDVDYSEWVTEQELSIYTVLRLFIPRGSLPSSCRVSRETVTKTAERLVLRCS